jgi:hypothetical protein
MGALLRNSNQAEILASWHRERIQLARAQFGFAAALRMIASSVSGNLQVVWTKSRAAELKFPER